MICLRCGYCCRNYFVILPDGSAHLGDGKDCKFLAWEDDTAVCTVHGQPAKIVDEDGIEWTCPWEETPCGRHQQVERSNEPCRIGKYMKEKQ